MATVRGVAVQTVTIKGREYTPVSERVRLAHADGGFSIQSSEIVPVGDTGRYLVRVVIAMKERRYVGTAEAHLNAPKNTADGDSPFETAETSALGRALGFAGYGTVDGVCSADEVVRAINRRA